MRFLPEARKCDFLARHSDSKRLGIHNTRRNTKSLQNDFIERDLSYDSDVFSYMDSQGKANYHEAHSCGPSTKQIHKCTERTKCDDNCFRSGPVKCDGDDFNQNLDKLTRYHRCWQERRATMELCRKCGPGNSYNKKTCPTAVKDFCSTYEKATHIPEIERIKSNFTDCRKQLDDAIRKYDANEWDVIDGHSYVFVLGEGTTRRSYDVFCTIPFLKTDSSFAHVIRRITQRCEKEYHRLMYGILDNVLAQIMNKTNDAQTESEKSIQSCVQDMMNTLITSKKTLKQLTEQTSKEYTSIDATQPISEETLKTLLNDMVTRVSNVVSSLGDCVDKSRAEVGKYRPTNERVKEHRELEKLLTEVLAKLATKTELNFYEDVIPILTNQLYVRWIEQQIPCLPNARKTYLELSKEPNTNPEIRATFAQKRRFGKE